jgi:serine/threonine protein kinase
VAQVVEQVGPYTCVRRLGVGGMAETFLAVQRGAAGFEQRVCVKFILPAYRENADFRRLFLREARIGASLRHSNIVGVIDVDASAGYLVLELVDGVDLRALLTAAPNRRLPAEHAILVAIELCKALSYAHGRERRGQPDGIVHRDISPSNVLVSYAGEVKLTDFGVARAMRADIEPLSTTVKGKLCYMSPEQARGQALDGRSDLFTLGILFYELLSGRRPFDGNTDAETLLRITAGQHDSLAEAVPELPSELVAIVERLLCRDREQRFASADACIDALTAFSPLATCFRDLGALARAARPHETLTDTMLDDFARDSTLPSSPNTMTATAAPAWARSSSVPPQDELVPSQTSVLGLLGGAMQRVGRNAWTTLALSCVLLLAVGAAWMTHISDDETSTLAANTPHPSALAAPSVPTSQPAVPASAQPLPSIPSANRIGATVPEQAPVTVNTAVANNPRPSNPWATSSDPDPAPAPQKQANPAREDSSERGGGGSAALTIGLQPVGQVWVDNQLKGWSPLTVQLKPGVHTIAGGRTHPEVKKSVRLKRGENRPLLIDLNGAGVSDDTTSDPADR